MITNEKYNYIVSSRVKMMWMLAAIDLHTSFGIVRISQFVEGQICSYT